MGGTGACGSGMDTATPGAPQGALGVLGETRRSLNLGGTALARGALGRVWERSSSLPEITEAMFTAAGDWFRLVEYWSRLVELIDPAPFALGLNWRVAHGTRRASAAHCSSDLSTFVPAERRQFAGSSP